MNALSPIVSASVLDRLGAILGGSNVITGAGLDAYADPYGFEAEPAAAPLAAVLPLSVEEVQAVLREASAAGLTVWTVSTGKNYGYGGAAPRVGGGLVMDLHRMDAVLEVDETCGTALVEPGVTFLQLHDHLRRTGSRLWASVPDIGWGSVIGNALERGFGYTPYGEHAATQCGMEVVLANGEVVRTGMGAKPDSPAWSLYKGGLGPSVDGLFFQSNLGVVTKMGVWLMPAPEQAAACMLTVQQPDDLAALVDTLRPLMLAGTIQSNVVIGNAPVIASMMSERAAWRQDDGPIQDEDSRRIMEAVGVGFWTARFGLYGPPELVEARLKVVRRALEAIAGAELVVRTYPGDVDPRTVHPADRAQLGIPSTDLVRMAEWRGGASPAHSDFSLVCPPIGAETVRYMRLIRAGVERHGFDYAGGFTLFPRHAIALALVSFDRSDADQRRRVGELFPDLIRSASAIGAAPYRAHLAFMDLISEQYDAGGHALRRMTQRLKGALDPQGTLSPGKQGIWPLHDQQGHA